MNHRAFTERVGQRLRRAYYETRRDAVSAGTTSSGAQTVKVLRDKDIAVADYYTSHSTARRRWRGLRARTRPAPASADSAGRRAGFTERPGLPPTPPQPPS